MQGGRIFSQEDVFCKYVCRLPVAADLGVFLSKNRLQLRLNGHKQLLKQSY